MKKYNIGWGITNSCNMRCKFCYSKDTRYNTTEVGLDEWIKFIDENHQFIDSINYGTGENALCDNFFTFIKYVRKNYPLITQSLTSNGYIYERVKNNTDYYNIYKECIDEVDISLDFANPEKHNWFRGQPKAYEWAINALNMLQHDGKKSTIVFVAFNDTMTKENIDGIFKIADKYDSLVRFNIYRPVSENKEINNRFVLDYKKLIDGLEYICKKYKVLSLSDILFGSLYSKNSKIEENTGVNSIRILPDGSICPSTYLITNNYRRKYSIKDNNVLLNLKFDDFINAPIPIECKNCNIKDKCRGGVYDRRILWNGSLNCRDPYCPLENDDTIEKDQIYVLKNERVSVHDGYLPTMFFKTK